MLGLTPYLYLSIRASMDPPMNEADPSTWSNFWYLVSGGGHHKNSFSLRTFGDTGPPELYWGHLVEDFHPGLLAAWASCIGGAYLVARDRAAAAMDPARLFLWMFHAIEYRIYDGAGLLYPQLHCAGPGRCAAGFAASCWKAWRGACLIV